MVISGWDTSQYRKQILIQSMVSFIRGRTVTTGDILRAYPNTRSVIEELAKDGVIINAGKRRWKLNPSLNI